MKQPKTIIIMMLFHKEIASLLKEKHPESDRNEKDVENKIGSLERQFRIACDWLNHTGQGVEDPGDIEAAVKQRCPLYKELQDVMGDRPNAQPLASSDSALPNEVEIMDDSSDIGEEEEDELSGKADTAAIMSMKSNSRDNVDDSDKESDSDDAGMDSTRAVAAGKTATSTPAPAAKAGRRETETPATTPAPSRKNSVSSVSTAGNKKKKKVPLTASAQNTNKRARDGDKLMVDQIVSSFLENKNDQGISSQSLRLKEAQASKEEAQASKLRTEEDILKKKSEEEQKMMRLERFTKLLSSREKLKKEGVPQELIDKMLPLDDDD